MSEAAPELRLVQPPTDDDVDPNIGITLDGRYRIDRQLGAGGMGLVYAATHVRLNKRLAVKVLKKNVSADDEVMARFRREAQAASSIGSPHICDVSDFGNLPDGSTYFVMEYLDGPPLGDVLAEERPMPSARIVDIAVQLCDALGAAHERGIVHRDLKPDNIHLVRQGRRSDFVKVLDFGIAKVGGAVGKKLTQAGQVFGTPHYMSPEQCSGREVDRRTDIYAVGVILYELSCGVVPFDADNLMGVLTKHVYEEPIPPREFPPPIEVPAGLEAIILKCLTKQPETRYQTMAELRADLQRFGDGATPNAVMQAVDARPIPKTQRVDAGDLPSLANVRPAAPAGAVERSPVIAPAKKRSFPVALLAFVAFIVLGLGAGAVGYFLLPGPEPALVSQTEPTEFEPTAEVPDPEPDGDLVEATVEVPDLPAELEVLMVHITSEPAGAEVYAADGSLVGNTPLDLPRPTADDGPLSLSLRLAGHQERAITLGSRSQPTLHMTLERTHRTIRHHRPNTRPDDSDSQTTGPTSTGTSEIVRPAGW